MTVEVGLTLSMWTQARRGKCKYHNMLLSPVYRKNLAALIVDEAHCVKLWVISFLKLLQNLVTYIAYYQLE